MLLKICDFLCGSLKHTHSPLFLDIVSYYWHIFAEWLGTETASRLIREFHFHQRPGNWDFGVQIWKLALILGTGMTISITHNENSPLSQISNKCFVSCQWNKGTCNWRFGKALSTPWKRSLGLFRVACHSVCCCHCCYLPTPDGTFQVKNGEIERNEWLCFTLGRDMSFYGCRNDFGFMLP